MDEKRRRLPVGLVATGLVFVSFAAGLAARPTFNTIHMFLLSEERSVRCLPGRGGACVGDQIAHANFPDSIGGVTTVFCGQIPHEHDDYRFVADFLARTCPTSTYTVEFSDGWVRTMVSVRDGVITELRRGPLHVIDL